MGPRDDQILRRLVVDGQLHPMGVRTHRNEHHLKDAEQKERGLHLGERVDFREF